MEAPEALIMAEQSLRNLIKSVMYESWQLVPGIPAAEKLEERIAAERDKRQGVTVSEDLIDYVYIRDLSNIFNQNRAKFDGVFSDKARFNEMIRILSDYRNTPFHARPLSWFESDLVTGASGWIVANISRWRNQHETDATADYPRILTAADEWGNSFFNKPFHVVNYTAVDVGQVVHFDCTASDADSRELLWVLAVQSSADRYMGTIRSNGQGESVRLRWKVEPEDVAPEVKVSILLSARDDYPRQYTAAGYSFDVSAQNIYRVRRPRAPKPPVTL